MGYFIMKQGFKAQKKSISYHVFSSIWSCIKYEHELN